MKRKLAQAFNEDDIGADLAARKGELTCVARPREREDLIARKVR